MEEDLMGFNMEVFDIPLEELGLVIPKEDEPEEIEDLEKVGEGASPEGVANEGEQKDEEKETDKGQSSQKNPYSSLATALAEEGVLPSFNPEKDKIQNVEDLIEAFRKEIKNNEFKDLTPEQKEYLEAIRTGVKPDVYQQYKSAEQQLNEITDAEISENQELRKQLIVADFLEKGIPKEKAEKLAQRSIDIGEDEADAKEALSSLKQLQLQKIELEKAQAIKAKQDAEEQNKKELQTLKDTINKQTEIIPGIKLTDKVKSEVFEQATRPAAQLPNGTYINAVMKAKLEDPVGFETKLNYLFYVTKGFSDFSKIATTQKSKAVRELDDFVKGNTFIPSGKAATGNLDYTPNLDGFDPNEIARIL